ncbi:MAG: V0D/AC39 family V-type ATPase subunit [Planctomycetota bacterium]
MSIAGDFDFIHAKVHGLRSRVYEGDRLDGLCDLTTIEQLWHRLYPDAEPAGHRALQRRLLADHVDVLRIIHEHLPGRLQDFFRWLLRRYQVENLKVLLRAWRAGSSVEEVRPYLAPLPAALSLPVEAMVGADSLADFLRRVPESRLRAAAEAHIDRFQESGEVFLIETSLDGAYYRAVLDEQARLQGADRAHTERLVRFEIAVFNLLCLFRLKLNYGLEFEAARAFFVRGAPLSFRLERLYDYPDFDDMVPLIPREFLPRDGAGALETIADLERAFWQRLLQVANRQFYRSVSDFGAVTAFYTIKRIELANLIRVVEGLRYGMGGRAIRSGLIQIRRAAAAARRP